MDQQRPSDLDSGISRRLTKCVEQFILGKLKLLVRRGTGNSKSHFDGNRVNQEFELVEPAWALVSAADWIPQF